MFEFPAPDRPRLTLEPWSADYGFAIDFDDENGFDEGAVPDIDAFVETDNWTAGLTPMPLPFPEAVAFIDGVQRIEAWARVDDGELLADAALASVAAGVVLCTEGHAEVLPDPNLLKQRVLAVSGAVQADNFVVPSASMHMVFEVECSVQPGRNAVSQAIAIRRRNLEQALVQAMLQTCPLVFADGRLDHAGPSRNRLVGIAKTLHQLYVTGSQRALIARLRAGERTPLFLIKDSWGERYSWFLRLPGTRVIHHSYAGIVRLETPATSTAPVDIADMVSYNLPRFASRPEHDPRAPQNLQPVGALEKRLRHELGDSRYIRRLIEDALFDELREVAHV
jgi:hypothetical protein